MSGEESDDKQYEASQKKLDDARKKGEIPRSVDLTTSAAYAGFLLAATAFGAASLQSFGSSLTGILARADTLSTEIFTGTTQPVFGGLFVEVLVSLLPWFVLPAMTALLAILAQRSLIFSPSKLQPKLNRISILSNAKNKFGRSGLFEFAKSFVKLTIFSIVLGVFLYNRLPEILGSVNLEPALTMTLLSQLCIAFFFIVLTVSLSIGAIDFFWQASEHQRKNRMSRKEMTDEAKQSEGDPHMKQKRRQRAYDIATRQMMGEVPDADVIIVNPTHYAIALKWDRLKPGAAPVCVAKGVDEIAARIREIAAESGVPIHRDPPTARAIFASVEIGSEILPDHYQPVAAAIRFAEAMRDSARKSILRRT